MIRTLLLGRVRASATAWLASVLAICPVAAVPTRAAPSHGVPARAATARPPVALPPVALPPAPLPAPSGAGAAMPVAVAPTPLADLVSPAPARGGARVGPAPPAPVPPRPLRVQKLALTGLMDRDVHGRDGGDVGHIIDVLVDPDGRPEAVLVETGGFLGLGNRKIPVAWADVTFPEGNPNGPVRIGMTTDEVRSAPASPDTGPVTIAFGPSVSPPGPPPIAPPPAPLPSASGVTGAVPVAASPPPLPSPPPATRGTTRRVVRAR